MAAVNICFKHKVLKQFQNRFKRNFYNGFIIIILETV